MSFKALFIHDDAAAFELVGRALDDAGCDETWVAASCAAAMPMLARDRGMPDLVVIDLATDPQMDPSFVRLARRLREIPILVIAGEVVIETAPERGVEHVIRPIREVELVSRLRSALWLSRDRKRRSARERALTEKIRKLEVENRDLERLVCADSLTGIANRRHVLTLLDAEWKRGARDETPLSVVLIDLDFFHAYNETYGHPGGDSCLRRVAETIAGALRRPSDFLGRYGGEELLVVLANTDAAGARIVAERLCRAVEAIAIPHSASPFEVVTISAGFATMQPAVNRSSREIVGVADVALLEAKATGRNRVLGEAPADVAARPSFNPWWTRFATVVIDPWLAERIPQYLAETRADARSIHVARRARNLEQVRALARKLRATARDHGFEEIYELGEALDHAARSDDREAIRQAAVELERYVTYVQVVYRRAPEHAPSTTT